VKELLLNLLVVAIVAAPLLLLEWAKGRSKWLGEHHDALSMVLWLLTIIAIYVWVLPRLGLVPNPRVFDLYQ
jgi:hypothetical protein